MLSIVSKGECGKCERAEKRVQHGENTRCIEAAACVRVIEVE